MENNYKTNVFVIGSDEDQVGTFGYKDGENSYIEMQRKDLKNLEITELLKLDLETAKSFSKALPSYY